MKLCGIYEILNTVNGKRYIGSANNFPRRWAEHRRVLRKGTSRQRILQSAWNKYGEAAFVFNRLLICAATKEHLLMYEQQCFKAFEPEYNICKVAGNILGYKHTPEALRKQSAALTGKQFSPERRANISASLVGRKPPPEQVEKTAVQLRGRKLPPRSADWCANISKSRKGVPLTPAQRTAVSKAQRGRTHSPEHVANQAAAVRGQKRTPEQCEANARVRIGKKLPPEHCANMSRARKGVPWSAARRSAENKRKEQKS